MNIKNLVFTFLFFLNIQIQTSNTPFVLPTISDDNQWQMAQDIALALAEQLPTRSSNEEIIDQIYGSEGLNIAIENLIMIKNAYCYLEFLVKIDMVKNNQKFKQYASDFKDFLQFNTNKLPLLPTQTLVESEGWNAIQVTAEDLINSPMWQNFIKTMVCDSMNITEELMVNMMQVNNQLFSYIPNIEIAYFTNEFANLWLYQEAMQLQISIQNEQRQRYLTQCSAWKSLSIDKLNDAITSFKKTDFYKNTHEAQITSNSQEIPNITSPTCEQILCYFLFINIQTVISNTITEINAQSVLINTDSSQLFPNFLFYRATDVVYFNDFFVLQQLRTKQKKNPLQEFMPMQAGPSLDAVLAANQIQSSSTSSSQTPVLAAPTPTRSTASLTSSPTVTSDAQAQAAKFVFQQIPTTSTNESIIEQIYGVSGLRIAPEQVANIKKTYCYLEFLVKLNKVKNDASFARYKTDFQEFLTPNTDGTALIPTDTLVKNAGWKAITITNQDILTSSIWQNYIKAMICDYYDTHAQFITDNAEANNDTLSDVLDIEIQYTAADVTQARLYLEALQLNELLRNEQIQMYLQQCPEWKNFNSTDLSAAITKFKTSEFYNITHNAPQQVPDKNTVNQYTTMSFDMRNEVVAYYLLTNIQTTTYAMMTLDNLSAFLTQASSTKLSPNFFTYTPSLFVYLHDSLSITKLIDQNNIDIATLPPEKDDTSPANNVTVQSIQIDDTKEDKKPEDTKEADSLEDSINGEVIIQKIKLGRAFINLGNKIAKDITKLGRDIHKDLIKPSAKLFKPLTDAIEKSNRAEAEKRRRQAARTRRLNRKIAADMKKNQKIICAVVITVVIVVAIVAVCVLVPGAGAALAAPLVSIANASIAAATAVGAAASAAAASAAAVGAGLAGAAATGGVLGVASFVGAGVTAAVVAAPITTTVIVAGAAIGIAASQDKKFAEDLSTNIVMPMMLGMQVMTEAFTEGLIHIAVGCTWSGASLAASLGYPVNVQRAIAQTKAAMEKHRSTINIVMSLAVTIVVSVALMWVAAQAGAMYSRMALAGYFGEQAAASAAVTAVTNANAGVAVAVSQENAASLALKKGIESGAKASVQRTLEKKLAEATARRLLAEKIAANASQQAARMGVTNITTSFGDDVAVETARLAARSSFQIGQEQGVLAALRQGVLSFNFIFGQIINVGFSIFSILGAVEQDQAAADALEDERKSIQALWSFVEDNKVNLVQHQESYLSELRKKHQAAVGNAAFGLQYYTNFLNSSVNNVQAQIAQALAQQQIQLLTPDGNGLRAADIGATWGLETQFNYLYPSQGFITTTLGRPDFPYAQEVAQAPLVSETHSKKEFKLNEDEEPVETKLWFNQRTTCALNQAEDKPLNIEIQFRVIYNLTTAYHVGLYLGGNYHDYNSPAYLQSIQEQGSTDLNEAHLAKMFVLKRENKDAIPSIGVYEHEGKGWITEKAVHANILNSASIYHMSANLNKDQLTVSFWQEDNPTEKWTQTMQVTAGNQRTFGIIFSGIAIEWGVVQPNIKISQNKQARSSTNGQSEIDRERASKAKWKQLLNPKFGTMALESSGRQALLQGQYLYTTQSTNLVDAQGAPITDYVVFARASGNNVTEIGANPAPTNASETPNALLSLITGNVYNNLGKIITQKQNALNIYAQNSTSISQKLGEKIAQAGQMYQQQLLNYQFGNYTLTAISQDAINAGLFIYTCSQTLAAMYGPTGRAITDVSGKPVLDYLIMADLVNNSLGSTVGMPPSSNVQGMVSLITGNVYSRTSSKAVDSGYSVLGLYTKQYGQLPQSITNAITLATGAYNNAQIAQAPTKTTQVSVMPSQTMAFTDVINTPPPSTGGTQFGLSDAAPSKIIATTSSISKLQANAAGAATIELGGIGFGGVNFGEGTSLFNNTAPDTSTSMSIATSQSTSTTPTTQPTAQEKLISPSTATSSLSAVGFSPAGGFGFGDYKQPSNINYAAPTQNQHITPPTTTDISPAQENTIPQPASQPTPQPAPATIDYSQFTLVGSSGFSF